MTAGDKQAFVAGLELQHGQRLRRFLAARLRNAADVPDLVQEVFLRVLRLERHEMIRSPEAYLFTVASHVIYQRTLQQSATPVVVEFDDVFPELQTVIDEDPAAQVEVQQRLRQLEEALAQLPAKARAALVLHRRDGFTLQEIAETLGISRPMAKKHLARALMYCRQHLERQNVGEE